MPPLPLAMQISQLIFFFNFVDSRGKGFRKHSYYADNTFILYNISAISNAWFSHYDCNKYIFLGSALVHSVSKGGIKGVNKQKKLYLVSGEMPHFHSSSHFHYRHRYLA